MSSNFIVGLDIGTSVLKAAVAEIRGGKPVLRAVFKEPALGLRKGVVIEMGEVSPAVGRLFGEVKKNYKHGLKSVYVNIGTPQVKVQNSRGIVPISRADSEIYAEDVEKVVNSSQAVNLATNRLIIHNVTREFIVERKGVQPQKVDFIPNWVDTERVLPGPKENGFRKTQGLANRFVVSYAGSMGFGQDLTTVLASARAL